MNTEIRGGLAVRLQQLAEEAGSVAELGRVTGIRPRTLANYCAGDSEPQASTLLEIARATSVSLVWLVTGRGAMRPAETVWAEPSADSGATCPAAESRAQGDGDGAPGPAAATAALGAPEAGARPLCGFPESPAESWRGPTPGAGASDIAIPHYRGRGRPGTRATEPANIRCLFTLSQPFVEHALGVAEGGRLASVEHAGKAMEPTLHAGDIVLVDQARKDVDDAGLFCLERGETLVVRRCVPKPDGSVAVSADNRDFGEAFTVESGRRSSLRVFGRVVMTLTKW